MIPLPIRSMIARWRFRRMTRDHDRRIEAARLKHQPVRHLQREKTEFVHMALRGGR